MGAGVLPMGMNMPQQPQDQGKGGGERSAFNQQLMDIPGFADSLQASQRRMVQDPNANLIRTQPALPAGYDPNVHQRGFGVMVQPSQAPSQPPAGMQGDQLRMQQDQMPFQMQPQMNNPMFGGLGAFMAMRGFGGGFGQPMGGFGGGFGQPMGGFGGFGGYAPPQFGGGFGGKGGGGFSQPQMSSPFGAAMGRGLGGLTGFF